MKLVLFPSGSRHFFSYTETDKEVSLILDESHVPGFPENTLDVCSVIWRAVQIEPGESGLATEEVVSQVSRALADINVSIMQLSTYDADFTLMPECDLNRALECLSSRFSISNNPLEDVGLQASDLRSWDTAYPMSPVSINSLQDALLLNSTARERKSSTGGDSGIASASSSRPHSGTIQGNDELNPSIISALTLENSGQGAQGVKRSSVTKARHPFNTKYPHRLYITSMEQSLMDVLATRLLNAIFFDSRIDRFFSFTQTDTTMSIIMDDATMNLFPDHTLNTHAGDWRLIAIGEGPLGFDECGIVSEFSRPLTENGISLFYLSTFSSDYIMVNDHDFEQAVACLHETARESMGDTPHEPGPIAPGHVGSHPNDDHKADDEGDDQDTRSQNSSEWDSSTEDYPDTDLKQEEDVEIVFANDSIPA
ncbi:Cytosolic arginine sensor for mTORC1 subunit 2 [Haplosporangium sp. Z 767]|nr:Cytosolic arginine sensor for mTORC1 subunit 2 [Haplosporangium sp. Z 767]KAF9185150.1 Cytosolic arginine sensor for mTORC1 subunit 2 [Haplosporangium sp. Z 11]